MPSGCSWSVFSVSLHGLRHQDGGHRQAPGTLRRRRRGRCSSLFIGSPGCVRSTALGSSSSRRRGPLLAGRRTDRFAQLLRENAGPCSARAAVGAAAVRGGSRGGLAGGYRRVRWCRRSRWFASRGQRTGAGRLRRVPWGRQQALLVVLGYSRADVDAVLSALDDERAVRWAERTRSALRRRSAGSCCSTRCGR